MKRVVVSDGRLRCSFTDAFWPIYSWFVSKLLDIDTSHMGSFMRDESMKTVWRESIWWEYCLVQAKPTIVHSHTLYALSPSWCRRFRKIVKHHILGQMHASSTSEMLALLSGLRRQVWKLRLLWVLQERLNVIQRLDTVSSNPGIEQLMQRL